MALKDWKLKKGTRGTYEKKDGSWLILGHNPKEIYIQQFNKAKTIKYKTDAQGLKIIKQYMRKH